MSGDRVEIHFMPTLAWATIQDDHGVRTDSERIGRPLFFVEVFVDGSACTMWSGESYTAAILEAAEIAADFEFELVIDRVVEGGT